MITDYTTLRDDNGQLVNELSSHELRRRLASLADNPTGHWRSAMFKRAYESVLQDRERAQEARDV